MKTLIGIAIIAAVLYLANTLTKQYQKVEKDAGRGPPSGVPASSAAVPAKLPGLPIALEATFTVAQQKGVSGLKEFLTTYGYALQDPRRAEIELDYVVLLSRTDPVEAKRVFAGILGRTPINSPVYERVKRLESTFR